MNFELDSAQAQMRDAAGRFLADRYSFATRRGLIGQSGGSNPETWRGLAELGLLAALPPEADGGFGGGGVEMMLLMEAVGEALLLEPFLETAVLGGKLLEACDSPQAHALLQ